MSKIDIRTKSVRFPVTEDLYGLFFEDINRSADGGLYPEMIRNRSFEDSILPKRCTPVNGTCGFETPEGWKDQFNNGEGLKRWLEGIEPTDIPAWYADHAKMLLDKEDTLNAKREASLNVSFEKDGSIYNIGYRGIAVKADDSYVFYMFAKAVSEMELQITVEDGEGNILADGAVVVKAAGSFEKYDLTLKARKTANDAILRIKASKPGKLKLGFTSLMPADTYKGHGMRKDLMEMLAGTHSKFLRFPGGCIVEGFMKETMMRFPNTIGPVWERPSHLLMWHYRTTNGLGYHEYLQICEDLNLEPMYVINCGLTCQGRFPELIEGELLDTLLEEACNAIDYAIAPADANIWGRKRAEAGHPEPFAMKYVEIGNENVGQEYVDRYKKFYKVLKEKYPQIIFIANIHTEKYDCPTEVVDEHYYSTPDFFYRNQNMFENYDRKGPKIFVGEYAVTSGNDIGNLYSALTESVYLLGIENNQDVVSLTSYAPLFQNLDYAGWYPNLIVFDNHRVYGIPLYYAIQLLAKNRGEEVLEITTEKDTFYVDNLGIPGIIAYNDGVTVKNVSYNGTCAEPSHQIAGQVVKDREELKLKVAFHQELECFPGTESLENITVLNYTTFGTEASSDNIFEADIKIASPDVAMAITLYNSHTPMIFAADETEERSEEWSPIFTEHYSWNIKNGKGSAGLAHWFQEKPISESVDLPIKYGEYMHVKVETRKDGFDCYIDGTLVQKIQFERYPSMAAVATQTEETVIVKIVNLGSRVDVMEVNLDTDVASDYVAEVLTADSPKAENTLENPYTAAPKTKQLTGASRAFTYHAPAYSLSILKLKKTV